MSKSVIKVGFCVAYDWELLKISVPLVYSNADIICFSIDKRRCTWSGAPYQFDEAAFKAWLIAIDTKKIIILLEGDFSNTLFTPIENDTLQRNAMAIAMKPGGWHIQIDSDEYILNFKGFCEYLMRLNANLGSNAKPINVCINVIPLIKRVDGGYLCAGAENGNYEVFPFATNRPEYDYARINGHFNITAPFFVLHDTWARDEQELWKKINNWGHRDDFNKESYYKLWLALDEENYKYIKNFHPIKGDTWPFLYFISGTSRPELIANARKSSLWKISRLKLKWKNSRLIQGIVQKISSCK